MVSYEKTTVACSKFLGTSKKAHEDRLFHVGVPEDSARRRHKVQQPITARRGLQTAIFKHASLSARESGN